MSRRKGGSMRVPTPSCFNLHEWVHSHIRPTMMVFASEAMEDVCSKNNLSLVQMLSPFCDLDTDLRLWAKPSGAAGSPGSHSSSSSVDMPTPRRIRRLSVSLVSCLEVSRVRSDKADTYLTDYCSRLSSDAPTQLTHLTNYDPANSLLVSARLAAAAAASSSSPSSSPSSSSSSSSSPLSSSTRIGRVNDSIPAQLRISDAGDVDRFFSGNPEPTPWFSLYQSEFCSTLRFDAVSHVDCPSAVIYAFSTRDAFDRYQPYHSDDRTSSLSSASTSTSSSSSSSLRFDLKLLFAKIDKAMDLGGTSTVMPLHFRTGAWDSGRLHLVLLLFHDKHDIHLKGFIKEIFGEVKKRYGGLGLRTSGQRVSCKLVHLNSVPWSGPISGVSTGSHLKRPDASCADIWGAGLRFHSNFPPTVEMEKRLIDAGSDTRRCREITRHGRYGNNVGRPDLVSHSSHGSLAHSPAPESTGFGGTLGTSSAKSAMSGALSSAASGSGSGSSSASSATSGSEDGSMSSSSVKPNGNVMYGLFLSDSDVKVLRSLMRDIIVLGLVPTMERRMRQLYASVSAQRRGMSSAFKRMFTSRKPRIDIQHRKLEKTKRKARLKSAAGSPTGTGGGGSSSSQSGSTAKQRLLAAKKKLELTLGLEECEDLPLYTKDFSSKGSSGGGSSSSHSSSSSSSSSSSTVGGSIEFDIRELADTLVQFQQWSLALEHYKMVIPDYKSDGCYEYLSGVYEMSALCHALLSPKQSTVSWMSLSDVHLSGGGTLASDGSITKDSLLTAEDLTMSPSALANRKEMEMLFDEAFKQYQSLDDLSRSTRACMWCWIAHYCLGHDFTSDMISKVLLRPSEREIKHRSALLLEQAAFAFLRAGGNASVIAASSSGTSGSSASQLLAAAVGGSGGGGGGSGADGDYGDGSGSPGSAGARDGSSSSPAADGKKRSGKSRSTTSLMGGIVSERRSAMIRKYAFYLILAAHLFKECDFREHAVRCYSRAIIIYGEKCWFHIEDHINYNLAHLSYKLNRPQNAIELFLELLGNQRGSKLRQKNFLDKFLGLVHRWNRNMTVSDRGLLERMMSERLIHGGKRESCYSETLKRLLMDTENRDQKVRELLDCSSLSTAKVTGEEEEREEQESTVMSEDKEEQKQKIRNDMGYGVYEINNTPIPSSLLSDSMLFIPNLNVPIFDPNIRVVCDNGDLNHVPSRSIPYVWTRDVSVISSDSSGYPGGSSLDDALSGGLAALALGSSSLFGRGGASSSSFGMRKMDHSRDMSFTAAFQECDPPSNYNDKYRRRKRMISSKSKLKKYGRDGSVGGPSRKELCYEFDQVFKGEMISVDLSICNPLKQELTVSSLCLHCRIIAVICKDQEIAEEVKKQLSLMVYSDLFTVTPVTLTLSAQSTKNVRLSAYLRLSKLKDLMIREDRSALGMISNLIIEVSGVNWQIFDCVCGLHLFKEALEESKDNERSKKSQTYLLMPGPKEISSMSDDHRSIVDFIQEEKLPRIHTEFVISEGAFSSTLLSESEESEIDTVMESSVGEARADTEEEGTTGMVKTTSMAAAAAAADSSIKRPLAEAAKLEMIVSEEFPFPQCLYQSEITPCVVSLYNSSDDLIIGNLRLRLNLNKFMCVAVLPNELLSKLSHLKPAHSHHHSHHHPSSIRRSSSSSSISSSSTDTTGFDTSSSVDSAADELLSHWMANDMQILQPMQDDHGMFELPLRNLITEERQLGKLEKIKSKATDNNGFYHLTVPRYSNVVTSSKIDPLIEQPSKQPQGFSAPPDTPIVLRPGQSSHLLLFVRGASIGQFMMECMVGYDTLVTVPDYTADAPTSDATAASAAVAIDPLCLPPQRLCILHRPLTVIPSASVSLFTKPYFTNAEKQILAVDIENPLSDVMVYKGVSDEVTTQDLMFFFDAKRRGQEPDYSPWNEHIKMTGMMSGLDPSHSISDSDANGVRNSDLFRRALNTKRECLLRRLYGPDDSETSSSALKREDDRCVSMVLKNVICCSEQWEIEGLTCSLDTLCSVASGCRSTVFTVVSPVCQSDEESSDQTFTKQTDRLYTWSEKIFNHGSDDGDGDGGDQQPTTLSTIKVLTGFKSPLIHHFFDLKHSEWLRRMSLMSEAYGTTHTRPKNELHMVISFEITESNRAKSVLSRSSLPMDDSVLSSNTRSHRTSLPVPRKSSSAVLGSTVSSEIHETHPLDVGLPGLRHTSAKVSSIEADGLALTAASSSSSASSSQSSCVSSLPKPMIDSEVRGRMRRTSKVSEMHDQIRRELSGLPKWLMTRRLAFEMIAEPFVFVQKSDSMTTCPVKVTMKHESKIDFQTGTDTAAELGVEFTVINISRRMHVSVLFETLPPTLHFDRKSRSFVELAQPHSQSDYTWCVPSNPIYLTRIQPSSAHSFTLRCRFHRAGLFNLSRYRVTVKSFGPDELDLKESSKSGKAFVFPQQSFVVVSAVVDRCDDEDDSGTEEKKKKSSDESYIHIKEEDERKTA